MLIYRGWGSAGVLVYICQSLAPLFESNLVSVQAPIRRHSAVIPGLLMGPDLAG